MVTNRYWRYGLLAVGVLTAAVVARPVTHLARAVLDDRPTIQQTAGGYADDVSRMSATPVREIWRVPERSADAEAQLVRLLQRAQAEKIPVAIAGARHSMGGHTIAPDGIVIDMLPYRGMSLSEDGQILTVQAGALWADVLPFLNERGRSVAVMQSDNSFSVGGSLSTNVHGWQSKRPPIASTVRSFRLLTPEGHIVRCSRTEHADLFSLVLGGYGLFGIILDAELWTVPNESYRPERYIIPAAAYAQAFQKHVVQDSSVVMAYGRLSVAPSAFLEEAILTVYRRASPPDDRPLPEPTPSKLEPVERAVFRGSVNSKYGKELRWDLERHLGGHLGGEFVSRNRLLNGNVDLYLNRAEDQTEVIHEYFLPPQSLARFVRRARQIIPSHKMDLLNVTLRDVQKDTDTFLRYANSDVIAVVMLYSHARTERADSAMQQLTQELIDAAIEEGGTYYLPYRPHATPEQFTRAYPQARAFVERKQQLDPSLLFQNRFFREYGVPLLPQH